ncbi:MAG: DEAD/DEAH box helicase, partial [Proteobacteria bacterium]|nr:DEAD/DEAH box helicase [Pseudomonadota bacterium]
RQSLDGSRPTSLTLDPKQTWRFLNEGVHLLREAGFGVRIPLEFAKAGCQRIRARMRVEAECDANGKVDLSKLLKFRWEVTLGDLILDGASFSEILERRDPVVMFRGQWVLLDPSELAKLPDGLPQEGKLPPAVALRAVLMGEHEGVPVIADRRLQLVLEALRHPPEYPLPRGLKGTLRPYQIEGFYWLTTLGELGLGACLADDMGLGKTIQLITHLLNRKGKKPKRPSLVVCPTSVLGNWIRELTKFAPSLRVLRHHGLNRHIDQSTNADVVLTTFGLLVRDQEKLANVEWDIICLDEAQAIKNPDSQRAQAARTLQGRHRIALSGTPIENRLDELWALMEFLIPGLLGKRAAFRRQIAVPIERFGDEKMAHRLRLGVSPFLLRRVKTDPNVINDLPEKNERRDYCTLMAEQARLYQQVVDEAMQVIENSSDIARRGRILAMLTALKQVCNHPSQYLRDDTELSNRSGKLERCVDLLDTIFDIGEHALIFTQYRQMGLRLQTQIQSLFGEEVPFLHGGTPTRQRDEMVRSFQEDEDASAVLIVSLRAGGTGLNLTRATHVIHYDRWWNPAVEDQATDRAYRIGQHENVQVHKLICQGTLEERIDELLEEKRHLAESIVGGGERWVTELDDNSLRALVALGEHAVLEDS